MNKVIHPLSPNFSKDLPPIGQYKTKDRKKVCKQKNAIIFKTGYGKLKNQTYYQIWTDGGCAGQTGAWAFHIQKYFKSKRVANPIENASGVLKTTSNRMELQAVIEALKVIPFGCKVLLRSDSQYLIKGITIWIKKWKQNNYQNNLIKNRDLWTELDLLVQDKNIWYQWVRGHNKSNRNCRVDFLCTKFIKLSKSKYRNL